MRWMKLLIVLGLAAMTAQAESARVLKVLPHFLDQEGRHALRPTLYERDAYQAQLRANPGLRSGLRFDIQWKSAGLREVKLRVEARGTKNAQPQQAVLEKTVKKALFGNWDSLVLTGEDYQRFGELTAWRVSLWSGHKQLAEQKSFLW